MRVLTGQDGPTSTEADLTFIDSSIDVSSGTILAKATLKSNEGLWPGQYVRVELTLGMHPEAASRSPHRTADGATWPPCLRRPTG